MPTQATPVTDPMPEFRRTDLGPLPKDWDLVRLGEVARVITGKTPSTKEKSYWDGTIPFITPADLSGSTIAKTARTISERGLAVSKELPQGAVLVSCIGYIGKVGVTDVPVAVTNQQINAAISDEAMADNWYLAYVFMHRQAQLKDLAAITTVPILNKSNFENFQIPLAPLTEQQAIAQVLRTIQEAVEATEKVIEATRELKRSLMAHLFTYGPVPVDEADQALLKETEIGPIPEHWKLVSLGELAKSKFKNGIFVKGPKWGTGSRYLNVADVYPNSVVNIQSLRLLEIPVDGRKGFEVEEGDVLFVRSSLKREGIARACMVPTTQEKVVFDCHLIKVPPNKTIIHPRYLVEYCRSNAGHVRLIALSKTTTMTTIPQSNLAGFRLPLPPFHEQEMLARVFSRIDTKTAAEENRKASLEVLFKTLLHNLMTGKVRVNDLDLPEVERVV